jgi:hypothetical protein
MVCWFENENLMGPLESKDSTDGSTELAELNGQTRVQSPESTKRNGPIGSQHHRQGQDDGRAM